MLEGRVDHAVFWEPQDRFAELGDPVLFVVPDFDDFEQLPPSVLTGFDADLTIGDRSVHYDESCYWLGEVIRCDEPLTNWLVDVVEPVTWWRYPRGNGSNSWNLSGPIYAIPEPSTAYVVGVLILILLVERLWKWRR